jgi:hypothetical protein
MANPNEFGDFDDDFKTAKKAEAGGGGGELIPEGLYKVVISQQDIKGDGVLVDHEVIKSKAESKGLKLFLEILDPAEVKVGTETIKTRGQLVEHVFWVTKKNIPFLKRDVATILGRDLKSLGELTSTIWAGNTCEVGVKHEVYQGFKNSRVSFFNAWKPGKDDKKSAPAKQTAAAPAGGAVDF